MLREFGYLVLAALLWGTTNPLLKRGCRGIENIRCDGNAVMTWLAELYFMATTLHYVIPFLLNQSGSVLFFFTLSQLDLSLVVPITNSLTFIFTGIAGKLLETYGGIALVLIGIAMCVLSKSK